jgi:sugar phosphate isomerase/epimerase
VIATARTLGMTTLVVPWLAPELRPAGRAGWTAIARRLDGLTRRYRPEGFALAYHNHDFEFIRTSDGAVPQALIFESAPLLDWEIDVAWVVRGGEDAVKWINDYRSIITIAHVKDIAPPGTGLDEDGWSDIGQGTVNWKACMAALAGTRCMSFVMEHDNPQDDRRFAVNSIAAARAL